MHATEMQAQCHPLPSALKRTVSSSSLSQSKFIIQITYLLFPRHFTAVSPTADFCRKRVPVFLSLCSHYGAFANRVHRMPMTIEAITA